MHTYISLRGDEGVKQCTHILACAVMKGLNSAHAHLECVLIKCIKNDRKIQDMGAENVFIYVSYD